MAEDGELLGLVGDIYDCAIEPARWPAALKRIVGSVGADHAAIVMQEPLKREMRWGATWGIDPEVQRRYDEYQAINPLMTAGWFVDLDEPFTSEGYIGDEFFSSRFYKEWVAPSGYLDAATLILAKTSNRYAALGMPRLARHGQFTAGDLEKLRLLAPHIRRSVTIADLLDAKALRDDMLSATLDLLVVGIFLVDSEARIVHANRAGARHLDEAQAVRRSGDRLSARDPGAAAALREAIAKATQAGALELAKTGIAVPIASSDGRDLAAWVLPLDSGLRNEFATAFSARAAVFLKEIGDTSPLPGELFVRRYGISAAECRVLMMLTQGMSPLEAADALGCSEPTVRTHLQRLFAKTSTRGQPDLLRLAISALAPASK